MECILDEIGNEGKSDISYVLTDPIGKKYKEKVDQEPVAAAVAKRQAELAKQRAVRQAPRGRKSGKNYPGGR